MEKLAVHGGEPVRRRPLPSISNKSGRNIGREELELLEKVIDSGALFRYSGTMVKRFEDEFANFLRVNHAVASTSGTSALHIATGASSVGPGVKVITTPITDAGTIIAILGQNAIPVFADIDPITYNITAESVRERLTNRTRAIIVVHLFGLAADMDPLRELADEKGLILIEDCAQAYLAEYRGRPVGTLGDLGCFSLQQSKHTFTGDGGITVTNDDEMAKKAKLFMDKGWDRSLGFPRAYVMLGFNYRMTELQGAVALGQLEKVRWVVERRRAVAEALTNQLEELNGIQLPKPAQGFKHSYWLYPTKLSIEKFNASVQEIARAISEEGVPASAGYIGHPIYVSPVLAEKRGYGGTHCPWTCQMYGRNIEYREGLCPNAEDTLRKTITLPCNEYFTEEDIDDIAEAVRKVLMYYSRPA